MAANMTYDSLVSDVLIYSERVDDAALTAQIPRLLMLAENRIATDMKTEGAEMVVAGALELGNPVLVKPAYWRDTVSFQVTRLDGSRYNLLPRAYEYCTGFWPDRAQVEAPRFYADYEFNHFFICPTPSAAFEFELKYRALRTPLDAETQTNWLTLNAPQLLFYALMLEVQTFLKNDEKITTWGNLYRDSVGNLGKEDTSRAKDNATERTR